MIGDTVKGTKDIVEALNAAVFNSDSVSVHIHDGTLLSFTFLSTAHKGLLNELQAIERT